MVTYVQLLNNLKDLRKKLGLKQETVASVMGIERTAYVRRERSVLDLSVKELIAFLNEYKINPDVLFSGPISTDTTCHDIYNVCHDLPEQWQKEVLEYAKYIRDVKSKPSGGFEQEADNEAIRRIREIIYLLPPECTIKISYNEILIIPLLTPPEHHELYYMLKHAGLLEEFIAYGQYKLSRYMDASKSRPCLEKAVAYPMLAYSSQEREREREREREKPLTCKLPSCDRPLLQVSPYSPCQRHR